MAGRVADTAGNALHGDRSRDHIVASIASRLATANSFDIANTAGTEHPSMDRSRSRGHMPVREGRGRPGQADQKVQSPSKTLSSDCPPLIITVVTPRNKKARCMPLSP